MSVFGSCGVQPPALQVSDTEAKLAAEAAGGERARGEAAALQKELTGMKAALDGTAAELTAERASSDARALALSPVMMRKKSCQTIFGLVSVHSDRQGGEVVCDSQQQPSAYPVTFSGSAGQSYVAA